MKVGDLVKSNAGTKHHGVPGLIVRIEKRGLWEEDELMAFVLYPDGTEAGWAEQNLEFINESR